MYRSETMSCLNLTTSDQASWDALNAIGLMGSVHFQDENKNTPHISREFYGSIKRCEEVSAKLSFIYKEIARLGLSIKICEYPESYLRRLDQKLASRNMPQHTYFDEIECLIDERHRLLSDQANNYHQVCTNINTITENLHVFRMVRKFLPNDFQGETNLIPRLGEIIEKKPILEYEIGQGAGVGIKYIAGVVESEHINTLKRLIHRVTRGNAITFTGDIEYEHDYKGNPIAPLLDLETGKILHKSVFLIVYTRSFGSNDAIRLKICRIIDSFGAPRFEIPENPQDFLNKLSELSVTLSQTQDIGDKTRGEIAKQLQCFVNCHEGSDFSVIEEYRMYIVKEKSIYVHMNMMKRKDRTYYGRVWVPKKQERILMQTIDDLETIARPEIKQLTHFRKMGLKPPTYFQTNEFTSPFQEIVNTYGVPRYKEANPGIFACATFPILFGIMFGDIIHGGILTFMFGYTVIFHDSIKQKNGLFKPVLPFRYMLFLMGFCALYFGSLYNDAASFTTNLFGSCYEEDSTRDSNCVYPWGVDPAWSESDNNITFMNSLKMKMAVIFGITHMIWGIIQKGSNAIHFFSPVDFLFEFIPQIVFFAGLFGYMVLCIFVKWGTYWGDGSTAPSIITLFITIGSSWDENGSKTFSPLYGDENGTYEHKIELLLLSKNLRIRLFVFQLAFLFPGVLKWLLLVIFIFTRE